MFPCTSIILQTIVKGVVVLFAYRAYHLSYICNYYLYLIQLMSRLIVMFHACASYFLEVEFES
jgi:hypothetical protein